MKSTINILFFSMMLFIVQPFLEQARGDGFSAESLRIGIYDNPPKLYIDETGQPKGIFPGILKQIAEKEGWKIKFIPLSFKEGLDRLEKGTLDIMQDVAWSEERAGRFGFTEETVMVSWGRVYKTRDRKISTLIDLRGKRIAYMEGGIYSDGPSGLKSLMEKFELDASFIPVNGYRQIFEYIDQGKADAGVVNRLYGKTNKHRYKIDNTPILISPISIRLAFSKTNPAVSQLIHTIDDHLARMKNNEHSIYYKLIDEYIREPRQIIPPFLKTSLLLLSLLALTLAVFWALSSRLALKRKQLLVKRDRELAESEKKFRTIFENLQDLYFETDLSGTVHTISPSAEKILNLPVKSLTGRPIQKIFHNREDQAVLINTLLQKGSVRDFEIRCAQEGNSLQWLSINADLIHSREGEPMGIRGILRDITRRKKIEHKLVGREERFREMARLLPCGIIETDRNLNITYANKTGLEMLGYRVQDLETGLNCKDIFQSQALLSMVRGSEQQRRNLSLAPAEHEIKKKDGSLVMVLLNLNPIVEKQQFKGFRASLMDLTEIKKLQKERMLSQKIESTAVLAGGIGHDFNNILLGLFGNITLAKGELAPGEKAYQLIEEAEKSMTRAQDLTDQLLTFARGGEPIKRAVTIDQVVEKTAAFNLAGSNIRLILEKPDFLWPVSVDKGQISQVISNIVLNARQAMPNGGTLKIALENAAVSDDKFSSDEMERYVKLSITDEGPGIMEKHLEKVFDPYFTTKKNGSGLGLAIVHSIVIKHHGYIYVNSTPSDGTTFVIYLPATDPDPAEPNPATPDRQATQAASAAGTGPLKILLMDDDPLVRDVSRKILNKLGHRVDLCTDGSIAVEYYQQAMTRKDPYDFVITDLTVPGGMGACQTVERLLEFDLNAVVVLASGYATDPVMTHYQEHGFKAMLTKPYTVEKIEQVIHRLFESP